MEEVFMLTEKAYELQPCSVVDNYPTTYTHFKALIRVNPL